jgi:hypothetical protein
MNILLAAMGAQSDGVRRVDYKRAGKRISFEFTGRLIAISNLPLPDDPISRALKSRVHYLNYDPTDEEVKGVLFEIASAGRHVGGCALTPEERHQVRELLCGSLQSPPDAARHSFVRGKGAAGLCCLEAWPRQDRLAVI